jgi:hypothetical protein
MTTEQIEAMIARWIHTELEASDELRAPAPHPMKTNGKARRTFSATRVEDAWSDLVNNRLSRVEKIADGLLAGDGVKLDKGSTAYKRLCRGLLKAKMKVLRTELKRMDGDYSTAPAVRHNGSPAGATAPASVPAKLFSEISESYLKEFSNRQPRTQAMIRSGFAKFLEVTGGNKPVGSITKDHCRMYKESMTKAGLVAATLKGLL